MLQLPNEDTKWLTTEIQQLREQLDDVRREQYLKAGDINIDNGLINYSSADTLFMSCLVDVSLASSMLRGFESATSQCSRIQASRTPGFEDLGFEHSKTLKLDPAKT